MREQDWIVLSRYVTGEIPPSERDRVERWIQEDPERERICEELREIWVVSGSDIDVSEAWDRFLERVEAEPDPVPVHDEGSERRARRPRQGPSPRRWHASGIVRAAAVLVVVVGGGLLARNLSVESPATENRWETGQLYATDTGELSRISLSDGSRVVVGVRSEIRVASNFGERTREVRVHGDAFFEVAPDPEVPFVVHTTESSTRVVGTSFSVGSRGSGTAVVVREGTVRVTPLAPDGEASELGAGSLGRVGPQARSVQVAPVDVDDELAWIESRMVFRNRRFQDVLSGLDLWYDVSFRVEDGSLADRRLSAILEHPPLEELLEAIAVAAGAAYRVDGDTVSFFPRPQDIR